MRLLWVEVRDFRNHAETRLEVPEGLVAAVGPNAQGKTNLLEAVHYLFTLSSPRVGADEPLVRRGAGSAFLRGEVETAGGRLLIEVEVRASGANRVQVNRSPVRRRRDLRSRARAVMFIPEDLSIVQGEPGERRGFLDDAAASLWPAEETPRRSYEKALRQRNRLLKEHEGEAPPDLPAWDAELCRHGAAVTGARARAVDRIAPRAGDEFETVSGERLRVEYRPSVEPGPDPPATEDRFRERLQARRGDEMVRRTTLVGPHRDELELTVGEMTARRFASHGESWAGALCLRLGVAGAIDAEIGEPPVLLLDDPFSGLDPVRRGRLGEGLSGRGQVLVAVPDREQVPRGAEVWEVEGGRVR